MTSLRRGKFVDYLRSLEATSVAAYSTGARPARRWCRYLGGTGRTKSGNQYTVLNLASVARASLDPWQDTPG
jgi:DNA primase